MNNMEKLLDELELIVVDLKRSADDLEKRIRNIRNLEKSDGDDLIDRDDLIRFVIDKRCKSLSRSNSLVRKEKLLWKQLKKKSGKKES